jgi:ATP-dependent DNA helicase RecG
MRSRSKGEQVVAPLDAPLSKVLGPRTAAALAKGLNLATVDDLLRHYPRRYAERGDLTDLASLTLDEHVTVMARIEKVTERPMRNKRGSLLEVVVTDGRGRLSLTFFNQRWRTRDLRVGRVGLFSGKVGAFRGQRQLAHPDYQLLADDTDLGSGMGSTMVGLEALADVDPSAELDAVAEFAGALVPIYPATAALPTWKVAQCVGIVLDTLGEVPDPLPESLRLERGVMGEREALIAIHRPASRVEADAARERLTLDEAFVLQTVLAQRRAAIAARPARPRVAEPEGLLAAFDARLPFALTAGQRAVGATITDDLAQAHPMHRLLQGEVGSGKTVVALRAMLTVVDAGGQAALLAPTEVLAQQHFRSITSLLGPLAQAGQLGAADAATRIVLLTGSTGAAARREALEATASGEAGIVIGTHALLEDTVVFGDLGLVVVDEQHRFGVEQRAALVERGDASPHVLVMTATPIPRTVAMTVFGDLETSVLRELPAGRAPLATHVVPTDEKPHFLDRAWQRVREEVDTGHRAYVVCPRIGGDDDTDGAASSDDVPPEVLELDGEQPRPMQAVLDLAPRLAEGPLSGLRVDVLHGRMRSDDKDAVMRRFAAGDLDVLVATTVIEVGVDVPEATVMVVMDADRFGVSQLHQLRGRVGRGSAPGLCLLVTGAPSGTPARERLDAVAATLDGFELSRVDLQQRREGDVLGAAQSGRRTSLRLLSVLRDEDLIAVARDDATAIVGDDPTLTLHPGLKAAVDAATADAATDFLDKS